MKFLLILGVVLIHCNLSIEYPKEVTVTTDGLKFVNWISSVVCRGCVPVFFILSSFLYFKGISRFDLKLYSEKSNRRVRTLLLPYILWCAFCALLLYIKHAYLHMSGLGIYLDSGGVNIAKFFQGFWSINAANNMPYAFAFWFIRNLMVFVILSPIAWTIGRYWWLTALLWVLIIVFNWNFYGFEWFCLGTTLAYHQTTPVVLPKRLFIGCLVLLGVTSFLLIWEFDHWICCLISIVQTISTLIAVSQIGLLLHNYSHLTFMKTLLNSTFMIYAVHQCFCSKMRMLWENLFGIESFLCIIAAYTCCFFSLVAISVMVYIILKKYAPKLLGILTGGR